MFDINIISKAVLTALVFLLPVFVRADIEVTEIAWMGTDVSANDEWIEIHNSGSDSVSLSGWTLSSSDGTPNVSLSGTIGAGEYKLLERTDDTSYPGLTALVIFTGALGNEGENLSLKQGSTVISTLNFSSGWPAGDVTTKKTMQWTGTSWVTATETAGGPTTATTDDTTDDDTTDDGTVDDTTDEEDTVSPSNTTSSTKPHPKRTVYEDMIFEIDFPSTAVAGSPSKFSAQALDFDRTRLRKGKYIFNMGDGTIRTFTKDFGGKDTGFFYHTYDHSGSYNISIQYFLTDFGDNPPDVDDNFTIEVNDPSISITRILNDGSIEMKNSSPGSIDLKEWVLRDSSGHEFKFPYGSKILAGKTAVYGKRAHRLEPFSGVTLFTPTGAFVATSIQPKPIYNSTAKTKSIEKEVVGEVLGASDDISSEIAESTEVSKEKDPNSLVWILFFVILVLLSVIAVMFLKQEEKKEEYLLIDE